jgi:hypothetical protein
VLVIGNKFIAYLLQRVAKTIMVAYNSRDEIPPMVLTHESMKKL